MNDGVARGYVDGHLRLSVVADPLRRGNTNNNTPAILHLRMVPGDRVDLTVAPKGFGSENMSSLRMFNPSVTQEQVEDHIVDCVARSRPNSWDRRTAVAISSARWAWKWAGTLPASTGIRASSPASKSGLSRSSSSAFSCLY